MADIEKLQKINTDLIELDSHLTEGQLFVESKNVEYHMRGASSFGRARAALAGLILTTSESGDLQLQLYTGDENIPSHEVILKKGDSAIDPDGFYGIPANSFVDITSFEGMVQDFVAGNDFVGLKIGTIARIITQGGHIFVKETSSSDAPSMNA